MIFTELKEKEFDTFALTQSTKSFYQTSMMGSINEQNGNKVYYLGVKDKNKIIAAGMFTTRNSYFSKQYLYTPRGFLADYTDTKLIKFFIDNLKSFCHKHNYFMLKIDPNISLIQRDNDGKEVVNGTNNNKLLESLKSMNFNYLNHSDQQKWIYVMPLKDNANDLIKTFSSNTRNLIRKAEKMGVKVKDLKINELDEYVKVMESTGERKGFSSRTLKYFEEMYRTFDKDVVFKLATINMDDYLKSLNIEKDSTLESISHLKDTKFNAGHLKDLHEKVDTLNKQIAEANDIKDKNGSEIVLSGSMFMLYGDEIVYLFSGNYDEFMKFNGQYAIQWNMMQYAIKNHYKMYNFYGITGNFDKHDPNYGIYLFKRGFNGYVVETIGELDLGITNFYKIYKVIKKLRG